MLRRFFKDSAIYATAGLLSNGIAFLMFPFFAHVLKRSEYGVIDIMGLLTTLVYLTVAFEINQGLSRYVAGLGDTFERRAYTSTALIYSLVSYTIFAGLALAFSPFLTRVLLGSRVSIWILRTGIIGMWVGGLLYVVQDQLRWQLRPKAFAAVGIINAGTTTTASGVLILGLHAGALGAIAGQLTGAVCALMLAMALSRGVYRWQFDWAKCKKMLMFSLPLVPASVGVFLNGYADRLAIQHEGSLSDVGVYGVGFRIAIVVTLLLLGAQGAITPLVLARHRDPSTPHQLAHAFRLFWALGCIVFLILSVFATPLVRILAAPTYAAAASVVPFLVMATFLSGLYVFAPGPTIAKRTRIYASVNVAGGLLNLGLAFALVPVLGIRGAGLATLCSSAFGFIATMALSQHLYRVPHAWTRLSTALLIDAVLLIATRAILDRSAAQALATGPLLARFAACVIGIALTAVILLSPQDLRSGRSVLSKSLRRSAQAGEIGVEA